MQVQCISISPRKNGELHVFLDLAESNYSSVEVNVMVALNLESLNDIHTGNSS